jgi:hypothetical protein
VCDEVDVAKKIELDGYEVMKMMMRDKGVFYIEDLLPMECRQDSSR